MALVPDIVWSQSKTHVTIKAQIIDATDIEIKIEQQSIQFSCNSKIAIPGVNAPVKKYAFDLELYERINPKESTWTAAPKQVEIIVKKLDDKDQAKWPRLLKSAQRYNKIKVDWDAYAASEEVEEDDEPTDKEPKLDNQALFKEFMEKNAPKDDDPGSEAKWIYLLTYNILQFMVWFIIFVRLQFHAYYYLKGDGALSETYTQTGLVVMGAQAAGLLEIVHAIFKLVKARPLPAFLLHAGRDILLYGVLWKLPPVQADWGVFWLFLIWSIGELIRYAFYFVQTVSLQGIINLDKFFLYRALRDLRYFAPLILLPLGFFMELRLFYRAFGLPTLPAWAYLAIQIYCSIAYLIGAPFLFYSMWKQRNVKVKPDVKPGKKQR